jgi:hypothetical protein
MLPNTDYELTCYVRNWSGDGSPVTVGAKDFGASEATTEVGMTGNIGNDFELARVIFTTGSVNTSAVIFASTSSTETWGKIDDVRVLPASVSASSENNLVGEKFTVYPNPASEKILINTKNSAENISVQILTLQGKEVLHKALNTQKNNTLTISHLETGVYFIQIQNNSGVIATQKLLIY